jgi:8-oxo-dGTP diphosphatase
MLATLCYIKHNNRTLMLHRIKKKNDMHQGKWNGLGGKLHAGETPEECVIREVCEESGLIIEKPHLRGIITFPEFTPGEDWYAFLFTVDRFTGELIDSPEGRLEWVEDSRLFKLPMWKGDYIFLKWLEQERFFSAKFVYKDKVLVEHSVIFH